MAQTQHLELAVVAVAQLNHQELVEQVLQVYSYSNILQHLLPIDKFFTVRVHG
jgi:hypothetical protein